MAQNPYESPEDQVASSEQTQGKPGVSDLQFGCTFLAIMLVLLFSILFVVWIFNHC